ncbi:MAG: hypothetical protein HKN76_08680, partial [Saprospiraceae bacterium]|nr:hypothetical protein [Saprospiraceae bacterium]
VNAPYVHPKVSDNISVKRRYLGFKENQHILPEVMKVFLDKKETLIQYIKDFKRISGGERRRCINYIEDFYQKVAENNLTFEYKEY